MFPALTGIPRGNPLVREQTIAILSDRNLFREGVVQLLKSHGFQQVLEYRAASQLLQDIEHTAPQLVLIDLDHGEDYPLPLLQELRRRSPRSTVVIIGTALQGAAAGDNADAWLETPVADSQVLAAVADLALTPHTGPLTVPHSKEAEQLHQLWSSLTPRQREVLAHLAAGADNLKIAANLGISERAVKAHISALLSRFQMENRTELALLASRAGLRPSQPAALEPASHRRSP
jgi:DNA-binding NarL/FixJ family response regulator